MKKPLKFLQTFIRPFKSPLGEDSQQQKEEDLETIAAQEQKQISFETLVAATQDFHSKQRLGQGGFGPVFKGKLEDGKEIAVKKLSRSSNQGKKEFTTEAKLLARVQHKNVVNLLGYCAHGAEKLLVYEYVANESLDKLLFKSSDGGKRGVLDWKKRYDVIIGVARGLLYLHEDSHICIVHRDIKASNILLDDKWNPKIADFGMARLFPEDQTHVNTRVAGTNGYMAPEYVMHGLLSVKADVFSYGVLVLELIGGRKNSSFTGEAEAQNLLEWVGLLCTQADPKLRPTMRRVVVMLSKKPATLDEPTRPGYPGSRYRRPRRNVDNSNSSDSMSREANASSLASASTSITHTATTSMLTSPTPPSRGKQPMEG